MLLLLLKKRYMSSSYLEGPLTFKMNTVDSLNYCTLTALLRQSAFPDMVNFYNNEEYIICSKNETNTNCTLSIDYPMSNTWYYLGVTSTCNYTISITQQNGCKSSKVCYDISVLNESDIDLVKEEIKKQKSINGSECLKSSPPIDTFRFIGPTYFSVKYYFNSNYNRSNSILVRNDRKPYFIETLIDFANNGGTLSFFLVNNLVLDPNYNYNYDSKQTTQANINLNNSKTIITELLYSNNSNMTENSIIFEQSRLGSFSNNPNNKYKEFNLSDIRVMLYVCVLFNSMSKYKKCPEGYGLMTQSLTNMYTNVQMNIPYPMMGKWYIAVWKECFDKSTKYLLCFGYIFFSHLFKY
jgi:hypothetical protein